MLKVAIGALTLIATFSAVAAPLPIDWTARLEEATRRVERAYQQALAASNDRPSLEREQKRWAARVEEDCALDRSVNHDCRISYNSARIVELMQFWRTDQRDCALPMAEIAQAICEEPGLRAKFGEIEAIVARLAQSESDKVHQKQIFRDQELWRLKLFENTNSEGRSISERLPAYIRIASKELDFRKLELDTLAGEQKRLPETVPIDLPPDWWGIDLNPLFKGKRIIPYRVVGDANRNALVVLSTHPGIGAKTDEFFFVNVITQKVVAKTKIDPDVDQAFYKSHGFAYDLSYRDNAISTIFKLMPGYVGCGEQLTSPVSYWRIRWSNDEGVKNIEAIRYVVRQFQKRAEMPPACDEYDLSKRKSFEAKFIEVKAVLADGTFLATIDNRYLVRFRPDLTSPFFYGRSDLVLLSPKEIELINGGIYDLFGSEEPDGYDEVLFIKALLSRATKAQIEASREK